ncbi:hypothetical protein EV207_10715 [Scopulibacillus darangshiensis]|uniref:Cytochrome P450 n=1 Tax=Scopulibacillus darangshiensis TaxID=442528 RepID=A0A4R2P7F9_9BACL|nr:cytochrome P450 [Scopulibacillus darangshiensis]TCP29921.1 hypothetical protein EV207_10715 [Scopulibacillus darangshiensis]
MPDGQYAWIVTLYDDAVAVLKDDRLIKDPASLFENEEERVAYKLESGVFMNTMLFSDMPDHRRLRGLVHQGFTPRMIKGLRGRIQEITGELLDDIQKKNNMNVILKTVISSVSGQIHWSKPATTPTK